MTEADTFGELLRQLRLAADVSREALAERSGLSAKAIGALERGERSQPRKATVELLAQALAVGPSERAVLTRLDHVLRARLRAFGSGPERYGLVHADTRLANLLVHDGSVSVIDFDDSGFSWYLYDLGTSVSFFEHEPEVPALVDNWLGGYRRAAGLSAADQAEIWTFIMFRRLLLVAWIGSHRAVDIAAELGAGYTRGSCDLAESYLSTH